MDENNQVSNNREVRAEELVHQLMRDDLRRYVLRDTNISGKLDLGNLTIGLALDIQGCHFLDEVDLRYCEFTQTVNLSNCVFHKAFNSGDELAARTVYRKDLLCNKTVFEGAVSFNGCEVEGNAYFVEANFRNGTETLDFNSAVFARNLVCSRINSEGSLYFGSVVCGGDALFDGANFEGDRTIFNHASFGGNIECRGAKFTGSANFSSVKVGGSAIFFDAGFRGADEVSFSNVSLVEDLVCERAEFGRLTVFNSLKCGGGGFFRDASFEGEVSFEQASFDGNLDGTNALFQGGPFESRVNFHSLTCGGSGFFDHARFESSNEVSFAYASYGGNLVFGSAYFAGSVQLTYANVSQALVLDGARFEQLVSFANAAIGVLVVGDTFDPTNGVDLRGCKFERFQGDFPQALRLVRSQPQELFSIDPYTQLEEYYRRVGNQAEARRIYYGGRYYLRKNALDPMGVTRWSRGRLLGDWWLKTLTGYGVRVSPVLILLLFFVILGTLVFWQHQALRTTSAASTSDLPHAWSRVGYSTDLLIPSGGAAGVSLFELGFEKKWEPSGKWPEMYSTVHIVAGWILVLLLVATLTGVARRW